ncbi:MAG: hypothetical protein JWM57_3626 [Phycisphaerales bacterium]|nr:hypothetical protein [Phycisphaerales bacterium]
MARTWLAVCLGMSALTIAVATAVNARAGLPQPREDEVAVTLAGGHDTNPVDRGRPVVLVAAGLGVPDEVFRDAFSHVHPAQGGGGPTADEARQNKHELLSRLEKYGVTNERLDEVSNYYRYRRQNGEMWKHRDAAVFAVVKNGVAVSFRVADGGAGYSSPPKLSVAGVPVGAADIELHFDKDLSQNGAIGSIEPAAPTTAP